MNDNRKLNNYELLLYLILILAKEPIHISKLYSLLFFIDFSYSCNFENKTLTDNIYKKSIYGYIPDNVSDILDFAIQKKLLDFKSIEFKSHFEYRYEITKLVNLDKIYYILGYVKKDSNIIIHNILNILYNLESFHLNRLRKNIEPFKSNYNIGDILNINESTHKFYNNYNVSNLYEFICANSFYDMLY